MASRPVIRTAGRPGHWWIAAGAVFALALAFGAWGLWRVVAPAPGDVHGRLIEAERNAKGHLARIEQLQQRVSTLTRSDEISRGANRDLQGTLAERDEEIAGLRADVAFYERLVGATGQRRGLSVHALRMEQQQSQPQAGAAWHFATTLTQNLNRGAVSAGRLSLSVEGSRGGKLQKLAWTDLRQQPEAQGVSYSFKYFQQVEGDVFLPAGFTPVRVIVRLTPQSGSAVEQSFTWADATRESTAATGGATGAAP